MVNRIPCQDHLQAIAIKYNKIAGHIISFRPNTKRFIEFWAMPVDNYYRQEEKKTAYLLYIFHISPSYEIDSLAPFNIGEYPPDIKEFIHWKGRELADDVMNCLNSYLETIRRHIEGEREE